MPPKKRTRALPTASSESTDSSVTTMAWMVVLRIGILIVSTVLVVGIIATRNSRQTQSEKTTTVQAAKPEDPLDRIRAEFYPTVINGGYEQFSSMQSVPWNEILNSPDAFTRLEGEQVENCVRTIGLINGVDDPVFKAYTAEDGAVREVRPLARVIAVNASGDYKMLIDGFYAPEHGLVFIGRRVWKTTFLANTLFQEGYHALQMPPGTRKAENIDELEVQAHKAQLEFNLKWIQKLQQTGEHPDWVQELIVINEHIQVMISGYHQHSIPTLNSK